MHKLIQIGTLGIAGLTTTGLIAFTAPAALAGDDGANAVYKRENDAQVLSTADDRDDDGRDTNTGTGGGGGTNTGGNGTDTGSAIRGGGTDHSRKDKTRDKTKDGPGTRTRDKSQNKTNDRSRNNTR